MGPFPHDAPPATISADNPAGTDGFEFVEFAHPEPEKLQELFTRIGYAPVARHRAKNITVWRQGDINYILNAEPGSHAMRFVDKHGPCAPSMAWRVVDAKHAFEHAVARGAEPYTGSGKSLDVPAIVGIGQTKHEATRGDMSIATLVREAAQRALADAQAAEDRIMKDERRTLLDGIPIAHKDLFETAGIPTTAHSRILKDNVPASDATVVRRLADAGTVMLGKLATLEFALAGPSCKSDNPSNNLGLQLGFGEVAIGCTPSPQTLENGLFRRARNRLLLQLCRQQLRF